MAAETAGSRWPGRLWMAVAASLVASCAVPAPVAPPAEQFTADCAAPTYATDMLVCDDPGLRALDAELARLWADRRERRCRGDGRAGDVVPGAQPVRFRGGPPRLRRSRLPRAHRGAAARRRVAVTPPVASARHGPEPLGRRAASRHPST